MGASFDEADPTADLLERARAGDPAALDVLFARHIPRLRQWASGRLPRWARDIADTTDLVQETVLATLKHLDGFEQRGDGALQAYLRQAIVNRIRNELRKLASRGARQVLETDVGGSSASPLDAVLAQEALDQYERALAGLRPEEREAVIQRLEFGLDYAELADVLGKPTPNAARMAVVRSLTKLAKAMRGPS